MKMTAVEDFLILGSTDTNMVPFKSNYNGKVCWVYKRLLLGSLKSFLNVYFLRSVIYDYSGIVFFVLMVTCLRYKILQIKFY